MSFKYRKWTENNPEEDSKLFGHNFDRKKIMLKKAGETYNVYDRIQAANVDVDIYETLEKYGMLPTRENAAELLASRGEQIYGEMVNFEHPQEAIDRANETWETLPLEIREQFGHDKRRFIKEGPEWIKKGLKELLAKQQPKDTKTDDTTNKGDNKNE